MGGTGGRGFFPGKTDPGELIRQLRDAEAQAQDQEFEIQVGQVIGELLADINSRDTAAIDAHLETVTQALGSDIEGTLKLLFGGSVGKHTYVDGLSDIDALVLIDKTELRELPPSEVQNYFATRLQDRLPNTPVEVGALAVTVSFADSQIQLLPAVRHARGFKIPAGTGDRWSVIHPREFSTLLTDLNKRLQNKLIPTIKLAKTIVAQFPDDRRVTGYHIEALAVVALKDYAGEMTPKALLKHFFLQTPKHVLTPVGDPTGQSAQIDEYLGPPNTLRRRLACDSRSRIGRRMQNAEGRRPRRGTGETRGVPGRRGARALTT